MGSVARCVDHAVFRQGCVVLDEMDTALLREHCFEAEERSHDYHTAEERGGDLLIKDWLIRKVDEACLLVCQDISHLGTSLAI